MEIKDYLKNYQNVIYKTFENALSNDLLSHAYLLIGNQGTPLLDVAKYLAKSIVCDNKDPFACNECITCKRIDDGNYPDFVIFNGEEQTIKKNEIDNLEVEFEKKAFEKKGIKIYILHLVENMTVQAVNAILKFLEEPGKEIYAFLTTNNESLVLPTILSRCQVVRLKLIKRETIIDMAINEHVDSLDAQLLSSIYNDVNLIKQEVKDDDYLLSKKALLDLLNGVLESKNKAIFTMQKHVVPLLNNKQTTRFFIDLLIACLKDIHAIKYEKTIYLQDINEILQELYKKIKDIDNLLIEVLKLRNCLNLNLNVGLFMDHLILLITKE